MTPQEAHRLLDHVAANTVAKRADHIAFQEALAILKPEPVQVKLDTNAIAKAAKEKAKK